MYTLAETIRDGIRYRLYQDAWYTGDLLRDYVEIITDALAVQYWEDYRGWRTIWARDGVGIIGRRYDNPAERADNLARGIHLHYENGYSQGDVIRIAHDGTLSEFSADLIHSLVFDGVAYAVAEKWTDTGFEVINSIGGLNLMDGPEQTLEYAINDHFKIGE